MSGRSSAQDSRDPQQAAAYIAALTGDLAALARNYGLETLGYLLDMAQLEASNHVGEAVKIPDA